MKGVNKLKSLCFVLSVVKLTLVIEILKDLTIVYEDEGICFFNHSRMKTYVEFCNYSCQFEKVQFFKFSIIQTLA